MPTSASTRIHCKRAGTWERPASVELILPDGSTAFQAGAGVRIHGGESRRPDLTAKHSLRIYFRSEYGTPVLEYDLFGGSAVDTFSVLVLRNNFTDSWLYGFNYGSVSARSVDARYAACNGLAGISRPVCPSLR